MLAVLITRTAGHPNEFIDRQNPNVHIAVLPIMDVKPGWNWTLELLERACRSPESTHEWVKNPKCSNYWSLFKRQDSMDHFEVCHGSGEAILKLNPVDVKEAFSHIASRYHSVR